MRTRLMSTLMTAALVVAGALAGAISIEGFGAGTSAGAACASIPSREDPAVVQAVYRTAVSRSVTPRVLLATFEAAWVESHANNLLCGDLDSLGVFQQRASWGSVATRTNVVASTNLFLDRAISVDRTLASTTSAGVLAQKVQVSAYPSRYDQSQTKAQELIALGRRLALPDNLVNTDFDSAAAGWTFRNAPGGLMNRAVYPGGTSGARFLEMNCVSVSGCSVYQDLAGPINPGWGYGLAVDAKCNHAAGCPISVAIWGLGGPNASEIGAESVVVPNDGKWHTVSMTKTFGQSHEYLRSEVYIDSTGRNTDIDRPRFVRFADPEWTKWQPLLLSNNDWVSPLNAWTFRSAPGGGMNRAVYSGGVAGARFLENNCITSAGCSVYQDVATVTRPGAAVSASVYLRCPGTVACPATLAVWGLGMTDQEIIAKNVVVPAGGQWIPVSVGGSFARQHDVQRVEVYNGAIARNLDVDQMTHVG